MRMMDANERYVVYTMYKSEKDKKKRTQKKLMQNTFFSHCFLRLIGFDGLPYNIPPYTYRLIVFSTTTTTVSLTFKRNLN